MNFLSKHRFSYFSVNCFIPHTNLYMLIEIITSFQCCHSTQKSSKKKLSKEYAKKEAEGEDKSNYSEPKGEITDTSVLKCQIKPVLCKIIHTQIFKCRSSDLSVSF